MNAVHNARKGVLLIHGLTGSPTEMKVVERAMTARGFETETPMLAGHGAGHEELLATGWKDWYESARVALVSLQRRCEETYVVGLCASSLLAVLLAAREPGISGMVLLSSHYGRISPHMPLTRYLLPLAWQIPALRKKVYWTETEPYGLQDPKMIALITAQIQASKGSTTADHGTFRTYVDSFYQSHLLRKEVEKVAKRVQCRTLLIHSLEDTWFSPDNSVRLANDLGTKDKTVMLITGCNHVLTVDLRKDFIAEQVGEFVAKQPTVARGALAA